MKFFEQSWVLVQIAFRNLFASKINFIIGAIIFFGTMFVVVGGALLDSLDTSMSKSIVGSVAGHVQIYSSKSKDELSIYGNMGGEPDLSAVYDFPKIKATLEALPNVKNVVPMGTSGALITSGNTVDITLSKLRELYKARDGLSRDEAGTKLSPEEYKARIDSEKAHVQQIVRVLKSDADNANAILDMKSMDPDVPQSLARAISDEFWNQFDADPYGSLEFLENKIAPLVTDADLLFIRYVGTDLDTFQNTFDRMRIADGQQVPKGQRGFLIAKFFYEENFKLKNARRLDKIIEALDEKPGVTIANTPDLTRYVKENRSQTRDIVLQLDGIRTVKMTERLQSFLKSTEAALPTLLEQFFAMDDGNVRERAKFFYSDLAPLLELYRVRVGDTLTIKAFTRSGYVQSVNVKVYGTFHFTGLEKSPLAGGMSLIDLMSFRDLYGYLTADKEAELKDLKAASGTKEVNRDTAEADLFGEGREVVAEATAGVIDEAKELTGRARELRREDLVKRIYTQSEIESGVVLNGAVILKDPSKVAEAVDEINAAAKAHGLDIQAVSWQKAAGILGQFINVAKVTLYISVLIIFIIAMVIINNAMMMATLQRTATIGTMRAIGAQRSFVLGMVLVETLVLGAVFGFVGIGLGAVIMLVLGAKGIPAPNDIMYFFFSGPKLLPTLSASNVLVALAAVVLVSVISTLIPAVLATRVSPLKAMQTDE